MKYAVLTFFKWVIRRLAPCVAVLLMCRFDLPTMLSLLAHYESPFIVNALHTLDRHKDMSHLRSSISELTVDPDKRSTTCEFF